MNVIYRDFEDSDFDALRAMVFCLYAEDPEGLPINDVKIRDTVRECMARPEKLRITMICADDDVVGYCIICNVWSNEYGGDILNIDELYIKKEYRNKQIASSFIRRLIEASDAVAIAIETTPSNTAAVRLYKGLGFEASPNKHMIRLCGQTDVPVGLSTTLP